MTGYYIMCLNPKCNFIEIIEYGTIKMYVHYHTWDNQFEILFVNIV